MATNKELLEALRLALQKGEDTAFDDKALKRVQKYADALQTIPPEVAALITSLEDLDQRQRTNAASLDLEIAQIKKKQQASKQLQDQLNKNIEDEKAKLERLQDAKRNNAQIDGESKRQQAELIKTTKKRIKTLEEERDALKELSFAEQMYADGVDKLTASLEGSQIPMASTLVAIAQKSKKYGLLNTVLFAVLGAMAKLAYNLHAAEAQFRKTTGATEEFSGVLTEAYSTARAYGVSIQDTSGALSSLYTSFTDFRLSNAQSRAELVETAAIMGRLGASTDSYAKSIQMGTKALGMLPDQASSSFQEVIYFAREAQIPVGELTGKYADMLPKLAKLGPSAHKTFMEMARVSKITGLEMEKLMAITDKFDTFEGAADQAGKLNAALGGNFVNAMSLMMETNPVKRFEMIRDSIMQTGLTFKDMSYYQRKFFVDSIDGLESTADLALLMSGNMDSLAASTEMTTEKAKELAAAAAATQTLKEALGTLLVTLTPLFVPFVELLTWLAKKVTGFTAAIAPWGDTAVAVLTAIGAVYKWIWPLISKVYKWIWPLISKWLPKLAGALSAFLGPVIGPIVAVTATIWGLYKAISWLYKLIHTKRSSPTFFETLEYMPVMFDSQTAAVAGLNEELKTATVSNKAYSSSTSSTSNVTNNYHSTAGSNGEMAIYMDGDKVGSLLNKRGDEQDASARNSAYTRVTG